MEDPATTTATAPGEVDRLTAAVDGISSPADGGDGGDGAKRSPSKRTTIRESSSRLSSFAENVRTLAEKLEWNPEHRLATCKHAMVYSLWALRWGLFCSSVTNTILQPNFPFLARQGADPDSFPSTAPFGFSAATYFLPMTALLGTAIMSTIVGRLSDRIGRRPCILTCLGVQVIGSIIKYLVRGSFWGFCAANFVNGLFGAALPVGMAYVSDVLPTRQEKDAEIGNLVAAFMLGTSGGGITAILMEEQGLFTPLFVGAGLNFSATVVSYFFLLEPRKALHVGLIDKNQIEDDDDDDDDEGEKGKKTINKRLLTVILAGAFTDNVGSSGLAPLSLSPLAFNVFFAQFAEQQLPPIMTQVAFKWIGVMLALTVIPGAAFSQVVFARIGPAGGCSLGNFLTGVVTIGVLYIVLIDPPSNASYAGFIALLYAGFPLTVISQLSTGPMLDRIAPADHRGFTQGLNSAVMTFTNALAPFVLGTMADSAGTFATIWTCVGISFGAALINAPLMFAKKLRAIPPKKPDYERALRYEDHELVDRALRGEWVPAKALAELNDKRLRNGQHFLVVPYGEYESDKEHLGLIRNRAQGDFQYHVRTINEYLKSCMDTPEKRRDIIEKVEKARAPEEQRKQMAKELGEWFAAYMEDSGYHVDEHTILYKQMIMKAFPHVGDRQLTEDTMEQTVVNYLKVMNGYLDRPGLPPVQRAFAKRF